MNIKENINKNIFRSYDLRGKYPEDIDEEVAYTIGLSYGSYLQKKYNINKCIVGHDNRLSSPNLHTALIKGILETGCNIVDIGLCTTPMNYYARYVNKIPGITITASHNPKDENGFKFSFDDLSNARGDMIEEFKDYTLGFNYLTGNGEISKIDFTDTFINYIKNGIHLGNRKLKVVIDPANGVASDFVKQVHEGLNLDVIYINEISDGNFPAHHPDPIVEENLGDLKKAVLDNQADLGIGYDGDADRVGVVDEKGNWIPSDKLMIIIIRDLIKKYDRKTYLYDVKCSKSLEDEILKLGGTPFCYRTGASYTQAKVLEKNIIFGAEYSGHFYFNNDVYPSSCGMYTGLRLLEILSNSYKNFSELLEGITEYENYPEKYIPVPDEIKFEVVDKVKEYAFSKNYKVIDIDGARINFEDGWALVRASNTGPNLSVRYEATTQERLDEIKQEFDSLIDNIKSSL